MERDIGQDCDRRRFGRRERNLLHFPLSYLRTHDQSFGGREILQCFRWQDSWRWRSTFLYRWLDMGYLPGYTSVAYLDRTAEGTRYDSFIYTDGRTVGQKMDAYLPRGDWRQPPDEWQSCSGSYLGCLLQRIERLWSGGCLWSLQGSDHRENIVALAEMSVDGARWILSGKRIFSCTEPWRRRDLQGCSFVRETAGGCGYVG